jgi:hypothetical protein
LEAHLSAKMMHLARRRKENPCEVLHTLFFSYGSRVPSQNSSYLLIRISKGEA